MVAVAFRGVRKAFGSVVAVENLDLDVQAGEFVSLLGPSGCGKTTCLRMLAGLEQASAGRILIGDRVVNDVPPSQRDVAMVFQSYALYPHMTVAENIAYPLKKRGVAKPERRQRVAQVAAMLQLDPLLERKPRHLSGGQQQRVALGRALVREPRVFLLDEPLSNLDAKLRAHMRGELIELHQRIGKTTIYVTHDQLEAMTMSDRIAVMGHGRLQQFGTPGEIYERPANLFVADFIGTPSMTLVDATLRRRNGALALDFDGFTIDLPDGLVADTAADPELAVRVGIRPEHVQFADTGVPGMVRLVEPMGHETIAMVNVARIQVTVRLTSGPVPRAGEPVRLALRTDKLHVFDRGSGVRLNADASAPRARS